MSGRVAGKTALVTGGAQGIGEAVVRRLIEEGAHVFITDVKEEAGAALARETGATFLRHDVSDPAGWATVLDQVGERGSGLHILVNNAGVEGRPDVAKDPEGAPLADWEAILRVNASGVFLGCQAAIPLLAQSGGGAITNIGSVAALVPTPFITAYGASKAAVSHLTRSVALHCAEKGYAIRCNAVHPGQVRTPMLHDLFARWASEQDTTAETVAETFRETIPLKAFQEPRDVADAVLFLSSDEARYVTGQLIAVDGGFTLAH